MCYTAIKLDRKDCCFMKLYKRVYAFFLSALLLAACLPVHVLAADPMAEVLGVYEGYYYASQGQTGVTLTVYQEGSAVKAIFDFYNLPNRSNAEEGSFYMDVTYSNGEYFFDAGNWLEKPPTYITVDLSLTLSGNVLSGKVISYNTYKFYAEKANSSYSQIQESIFKDHRYELIDTAMSWSQAQKYAQDRGGYLTTVTSAEEQAFLEGFLSHGSRDYYWLGATVDNGTVKWSTGETSPYTNWTGAPGSGQYLQAARSGRWLTAADASSSNAGFIIEYGVWSNSSTWAESELKGAYENDLIPDVLIGRDMKQSITRGEFAAVAVKLYESMTGNRTIIAMDAPFTDISTCAERLYILKAYNYQLVSGTSATTYAPDELLTREQMATMLTRVWKKAQWPDYTTAADTSYPLSYNAGSKFSDDQAISAYARDSVYFMASKQIIQGLGNNMFAPRNTTSAQAASFYANATREQALLISYRSLTQLR